MQTSIGQAETRLGIAVDGSSCPQGRQPGKASQGQVLNQAIDQGIVSRDAGKDDQTPTPSSSLLSSLGSCKRGNLLVFEGFGNHAAHFRFGSRRETAYSYRRQKVLVGTAVAVVARVSLHTANGPRQGRYNFALRLIQLFCRNSADKQDIRRTVIITTKLVDVLTQFLSLTGANIGTAKNVRGLHKHYMQSLASALLTQRLDRPTKSRGRHDNPLGCRCGPCRRDNDQQYSRNPSRTEHTILPSLWVVSCRTLASQGEQVRVRAENRTVPLF